ncbi:uncharacterized protein B0P05DRAFT_375861 [Gilbertella persicaria]|uniref:uncharacterized protein n=1 Tax=Gilbertella persicaria TaxID=101096 RepID=UPI002220C0DC|nr:uncharacterized protein B0P05DRAFT_375861 [Gilbertella persicaria]KAI8087828.1 hypothetical protein B0P05DRAFT_375861 [Gilbertella persicaria]
MVNIKALKEMSESGTATNRNKQQKKSNYGSFHHVCYSSHNTTPDFTYSFYTAALPSTLHTKDLLDLLPVLEENKNTCFWIDITDPTPVDMKQLQGFFYIHPMTVEDITTREPREKCEAFDHYYFLCFQTFESDAHTINYLQPMGVYILIFKGFVLSFHSGTIHHPANVRKRILHLGHCLPVTPDWICYGLLDDIVDSFMPLIKSIEFEVDSIDELVLILKETEQSDMLRRIGYCRKKIMSLLRLLVSKSEVIKTLVKRGAGSDSISRKLPFITKDVIMYLGDVQDHIVAMLQSLNHYEKISSRSHSNYLAQISIEMTQTNNEINDILSKLTALGSVMVPMNLVTGLFGMNVQVPGQSQEDLYWFFSIVFCIFAFCILSILVMRFYRIL